MSKNWIMALLALAAVLATSPMANAQSCGDLNNDSNVNVIDALLLSQCLAGGGTCPTAVCGGNPLVTCGDVFGDGDVSVSGLTADLGTLALQIAGVATLFEPCEGPGPDVAGCPAASVGTQTIVTNQTWPAGCTITLTGSFFVDGGATLTIEPGVVVKGLVGAVDPPGVFILPGAKIDAQGTPSSPIIMTSSASPGSRDSGDWGGLNINGRSTVNRPGCTFAAEGLPTPFGGCIEDDFSGIVTFTRVEFAGVDFTPNSELNAITLNGIGSQTQINFTQAHNTNDDCHEWFGGTSSHKNMISSACGDDGFDCQLGWTGKLQYGLMFQDGTVTDAGRDSRGIECDNSEFGNNDQPRGDGTMCNLTLIGGEFATEDSDCTGAGVPAACCTGISTGTCGDINDGSDAGILLRRGVDAQIANTIVTGFGDAGVEMRDTATATRACTNPTTLTGDVMLRGVIVHENGGFSNSACVAAGDPAPCCTGAGAGTCAGGASENCKFADTLAGATCTSCQWLNALAAGGFASNPNGSNAVTSGLSFEWPGIDNSACTGAGTPDPCCSGAGTGSCREIPDVIPSIGGVPPALVDCTDDTIDEGFGSFFDDAPYYGAVDPSAGPCTASGCDWITKPWAGFARN